MLLSVIEIKIRAYLKLPGAYDIMPTGKRIYNSNEHTKTPEGATSGVFYSVKGGLIL